MTKERLKTLLLTVLVTSSIIFSGQIWFDQKLWPEGYDFFSMYKGTFIEKIARIFNADSTPLTINVTGALDSVFSPRQIILNYIEGRLTFNTSQESGVQLRATVNDALKTALTAPTANVTVITEEDWRNTLKARSICADYTVPVSVTAIGKFLGIEDVALPNFSAFDQVAIVPDTILNSVSVYFRNRKTAQQIKVLTSMDRDSVVRALDIHSGDHMQDLSYPFEIHIDQWLEEGNENQKIVFDSYILIPVNPIRMPVIQNQPVEINNDSAERILKTFGYNPNTVLRFIEKNDSILFVQTDSSLRIRTDGYVEYKAVDNKSGIKLGNDKDLTTAVVGSAKMIDDLMGCFSIDPNTKLFINTPLDDDAGKTDFTFHFDYIYNGNPVTTDGHAATVQVSNGEIVSLQIYLKSYTMVDPGQIKDTQDVLGHLYDTIGPQYQQFEILQFYPGYIDDPVGPMPMNWQAVVENIDTVITIT